ncbi:MAG: spore coat U domain-containing protein [Chromatiales bacterium]|nr:spore coat U domain-containing protein [Chromatiales bacterium]
MTKWRKRAKAARSPWAIWSSVCFLLLLPPVAQAATCKFIVQPVDFGIYNPGAAASLDVTGSVDVRCTGSAGSFVLTISQSSSGGFAPRRMVSGPYLMEYNLYADPARQLIWGDGTGGTVVNSGEKTSAGPPVSFSFPIYGRIFPRQSVGEGLYTDTLLVTSIY